MKVLDYGVNREEFSFYIVNKGWYGVCFRHLKFWKCQKIRYQ